MVVNIYCLKCPETGEVRYVGKTVCSLQRRLNKHMHESTLNSQENHRTNWLKSLKRKTMLPIIELLEIVNDLNWVQKEREWISKFRNMGANLINSNDGGDGQHGRILSKETKDKISKALMGHTVSEETRQKNRLKKLGSVWTDESKLKISILHKGRKRPKETGERISKALKGRKMPEEYKNRLSEKMKGRKRYNTKPVIQFNKNSEKIKDFSSVTEASKITGILISAIHQCLAGKSKSSGGFIWKYRD